jgi:hypothetical protein
VRQTMRRSRTVLGAVLVASALLPTTASPRELIQLGSARPLGAHGAAAPAPALHSPRWLRQHCLISAFVDLGGNKPTAHKDGLSIQGKETPITVDGTEEPAVRYTWHLSKQDQFCGIVGVWPGPPRPTFVSLMPTAQSSRGGEYLDHSLEKLYGTHLEGFFVYARAAEDGPHKAVHELMSAGRGEWGRSAVPRYDNSSLRNSRKSQKQKITKKIGPTSSK